MKNALIFIDPDVPIASFELLSVLDLMYGPRKYVVKALAVGGNKSQFEGVVDEIVCIDQNEIDRYDIENVTVAIDELHNDHRFDAIVIPATTTGRMLAPRVAMRLHVGLVADVTEIRRGEKDDGDTTIELVRPAFSGRMLAAVVCKGDGPTMLTVRQNTFSRDDIQRDRSTTVRHFSPNAIRPSRVRLIERRRKTESYDIRESDVLVSGGGGVLRSFDELQALAEQLHGRVSASRRVVDSGKAPRNIQVGQSGKTVSPRLYLAVGISGSIQHVVGLKNAEYIITVNSDRRAPICSLSDIVVEGDARTFVKRLIERIKRDGAVPPEPRDINKPHQSNNGGTR